MGKPKIMYLSTRGTVDHISNKRVGHEKIMEFDCVRHDVTSGEKNMKLLLNNLNVLINLIYNIDQLEYRSPNR